MNEFFELLYGRFILKILLNKISVFINLNNKQIPGTIIGFDKNEGIIISTGTDPIMLLAGKLEGKNISKNKWKIRPLHWITSKLLGFWPRKIQVKL